MSQLPSDEALLQMYLAGELDGQDRAEVDRRLAGDALLRVRLDQMSAMQTAVHAGMGRLDAADPLPIDESAAVRNASRAMRQWAARQAQQPAETLQLRQRTRLPVWLIGSAAAAIAVALCVSMLSRPTPKRELVAGPVRIETPPEIRELRRDAADWFATPPELAILPDADPMGDRPMPSLDDALADAQVFEIPLDPSDFGRP